jgi:LacI family transcriptional regulator
MPTIKDVAAKANVSATTVSHTLNSTRVVDPGTQERVWAAVRELGYRPNSLARGLRRRETRTIGLVVPDIANPFFADLSRAIEDAGFAQGYSVILGNSDRSDVKEAAYVEVLLAKRVDGLILASASSRPEALRQILLAGTPVVVLPGELSDVPVDIVMIDDVAAGAVAGEYLVQLGHHRIGCITGPRDTSASAGRVSGFRRSLAASRIDLVPEATIRGDFREHGGRATMEDLIRRDLGLTAVFAANDLMAIGALSALRDAGRKVPDDVSLIGFDGITHGASVMPPLTTVAQPLVELGETAVRVLLDRMREPGAPPRRELLQARLVERQSCRPLGTERNRVAARERRVPGRTASSDDVARVPTAARR